MDIGHIPEQWRARLLSSIVRNGRKGIIVRFEAPERNILPITVTQSMRNTMYLAPAELEHQIREELRGLPFELRVSAR